ncbi:hypothetical protein D3C87_1853860 [compost metagenome]
MAGFGEGKLTRRAVQKQRAEVILQLADIFGKTRLGAAGTARGGGKTLGFDHIDEGAHAGEGVQGMSPEY